MLILFNRKQEVISLKKCGNNYLFSLRNVSQNVVSFPYKFGGAWNKIPIDENNINLTSNRNFCSKFFQGQHTIQIFSIFPDLEPLNSISNHDNGVEPSLFFIFSITNSQSQIIEWSFFWWMVRFTLDPLNEKKIRRPISLGRLVSKYYQTFSFPADF